MHIIDARDFFPKCCRRGCSNRPFRVGLCTFHYELRRRAERQRQQAFIDRCHTEAGVMELKRLSDESDCTSIYAILNDGDPPAVKFGYSNDPEKRFSDIQVSNAGALKLLGALPGTVLLEAAIHDILASFHVRGEWFRYTGLARQVADAIEAEDLDALEACF